MTLNDALNQIIDDGIEAARLDYSRPQQKLKLEGSIAGFEDCRGKSPDEIAALADEAERTAFEVLRRDNCEVENYWYWRCRALEIEWVVNVLSNILVAQGIAPVGRRTARGALKAAEIIGVKVDD